MTAVLFVLLFCVVGIKNAFAQNQVATLQHNGEITNVYYGQNAFVMAKGAAVSGDVITLSSGTFNSGGGYLNYNGITIHGAGCIYDTLTTTMPTIITGDVNLGLDNVSFEGIWFTGRIISDNTQLSATAAYSNNNVSFVKCNINVITTINNNRRNNWQLMDCIINDFGMSTFHGMSIFNSVVRFTAYSHNDNSNCTSIYNSIIMFDNGLNINNINVYNSVITTFSEHTVSNCTFNNCIGIETGETSLFEGQITQNVMVVDNYDDVFETFDGTISFENIYQLKNSIATSFLGQDGTEVGIYGGMMPYRTRPNYMIIKNCNVAGRTTEDNKLSVEIELLNSGE